MNEQINMLTIEKFTHRDELSRLEPVWNALLERSEANTIALTYEWISTWWDVFGQGRELFILAVREGGEVIGIAPLLRRWVRHLGVPCRRIEWLASGEERCDEICSNYLDFISLRGREAEILRAILDYLHSQETDWDELTLKSLRADSMTTTLLCELGPDANLKCQISDEGEAVYLPLSERWDAFLQGVSPKMRRQIDRNQRDGLDNGWTFKAFDQANKESPRQSSGVFE